MRKTIRNICRIICCLLAVLLCLTCAACFADIRSGDGQQLEREWPTQAATHSGKVIDARKFVEQSAFEIGGAGYSLQTGCAPQPGVKALVVPHHTVASKLAAEMLKGLAAHPPKTVILLGPNHASAGPKIASTYAAFSSYHSMVRPDEELVQRLERERLAGISDALFEEEHSIGALIPLIARYLPEANVVPVIFHRGTPLQQTRSVIDAVYSFADPDAVLIASIDFSHTLPTREEPARREKMLQYIKDYNWSTILTLDETYIDAPVILAALLQLLEENGGSRMEVAASANASDMLGFDVPDATGYLTLAFY